MLSNAKNFAKEVANLKMQIAEKEAQLEALTIDIWFTIFVKYVIYNFCKN